MTDNMWERCCLEPRWSRPSALIDQGVETSIQLSGGGPAQSLIFTVHDVIACIPPWVVSDHVFSSSRDERMRQT